jgi:hypothetical protein
MLRRLRARGDVGTWAAKTASDEWFNAIMLQPESVSRAEEAGRFCAIAQASKRTLRRVPAVINWPELYPEHTSAFLAGVAKGALEVQTKMEEAGLPDLFLPLPLGDLRNG